MSTNPTVTEPAEDTETDAAEVEDTSPDTDQELGHEPETDGETEAAEEPAMEASITGLPTAAETARAAFMPNFRLSRSIYDEVTAEMFGGTDILTTPCPGAYMSRHAAPAAAA